MTQQQDGIYRPACAYEQRALPSMRRQCRKVTGFQVKRDGTTWAIVDTDTFNNWRTISGFTTRDAAVVGAWRAWEFKTGQRQVI